MCRQLPTRAPTNLAENGIAAGDVLREVARQRGELFFGKPRTVDDSDYFGQPFDFETAPDEATQARCAAACLLGGDGGLHRLQRDPISAARVAQDMPPAAGALNLAGFILRRHDRSRAGDDDDAGPAQRRAETGGLKIAHDARPFEGQNAAA